jgi:2-iminobutanoate/2-iminopropanoate deaminase
MVEPVKPVGPYSPLVKAGPWLVCSGQVGIADGAIVEGGLEAELRQAFANLRGLLAAEGATLDAVTKTTVFLVDMADYGEMNRVYIDEFGDHRPARSAVAVKELPVGAQIEIEAWCYVGS